jgi:hypothetical protein
MKKTIVLIACVAVLAVSTKASAQFIDLISFGNVVSGGIPSLGNTEGAGSQTATSVNFTSAIALSDAFYNALELSPALSLVSSETLYLKVSSPIGHNPNLTFNIFDSSWDQGADNIGGSTADTPVTIGGFSYFPLVINGSPDLANITYLNFSWGGSSTGTTPNISLNGIATVPEPSTYALMALGGLVLFFAIRRRSAQA